MKHPLRLAWQTARRCTAVLLVALAMAAVPPANAGSDHTGLFSNLEFHPESGDLVGYELYIALTRTGYTGVLLDCQGECSPMQLVDPAFDGDRLTFRHTDLAGDVLTFSGVVGPSGVTGSFSLPGVGPLEPLRLERKDSYWNGGGRAPARN